MVNKISIKKSEVDLQFSSSKDTGSSYRVDFFVSLYPKSSDHSGRLTMRNVDEKSLKEAIFSHFTERDEKYMELRSFDTTKATFYLKEDKWIKDATKGLTGTKDITNFSISFKLKEPVPSIIKKEAISKCWSDFVSRKIKNWVSEKKGREDRLLNIIFPKKVLDSITRRLYNMFDWDYDFKNNKVIARLKGVWISALMYSTIQLVKKETSRKTPVSRRSFSENVKRETARKKPRIDKKRKK